MYTQDNTKRWAGACAPPALRLTRLLLVVAAVAADQAALPTGSCEKVAGSTAAPWRRPPIPVVSTAGT